MIRGQRDPEPQGFTFSSNRKWNENWALELDSPTDVPVLCAAFSLGARTERPRFNLRTNSDGSFDVVIGSQAKPFPLHIDAPAADGGMRIFSQTHSERVLGEGF